MACYKWKYNYHTCTQHSPIYDNLELTEDTSTYKKTLKNNYTKHILVIFKLTIMSSDLLKYFEAPLLSQKKANQQTAFYTYTKNAHRKHTAFQASGILLELAYKVEILLNISQISIVQSLEEMKCVTSNHKICVRMNRYKVDSLLQRYAILYGKSQIALLLLNLRFILMRQCYKHYASSHLLTPQSFPRTE